MSTENDRYPLISGARGLHPRADSSTPGNSATPEPQVPNGAQPDRIVGRPETPPMTKYNVQPPEWPHVGDRDVTPRGYRPTQPIPLDAATVMWPIESGNRSHARGRLKVAASVDIKKADAARGPKVKPPKPSR
jgi:hypothetical protein